MTDHDPRTPADAADTYFTAWKAKDFDLLRSVLADEATFRGPLGTADNADDCIGGPRGMAELLTDIVVLERLSDQTDVMTWFDLHTADAPPVPTVNWQHVENGKITRNRVTFDPRPLL